MTESKADELRRLAPWTTIECDMCGSMHLSLIHIYEPTRRNPT